MMIPTELVVITNYVTITNANLRNTFTGLILPSVTSVFYIYLLKENFSQIPDDLMLDLAREQIELAFQSAQQEVDYLHQRTSEGVRRAQAAGKQVGRATGSKIETKKSKAAKEKIRALSRDFNGSLMDIDVMQLVGITRNTYYKYKKELQEEAN